MSVATSTSATLFLFLLLLLSPSGLTMLVGAIRPISPSPLTESDQSFTTLEPKTIHQTHKFHSREVNGCLPKGFHRTSAPSRYINYNTFGSTMCSTGKRIATRKPWKLWRNLDHHVWKVYCFVCTVTYIYNLFVYKVLNHMWVLGFIHQKKEKNIKSSWSYK